VLGFRFLRWTGEAIIVERLHLRVDRLDASVGGVAASMTVGDAGDACLATPFFACFLTVDTTAGPKALSRTVNVFLGTDDCRNNAPNMPVRAADVSPNVRNLSKALAKVHWCRWSHSSFRSSSSSYRKSFAYKPPLLALESCDRSVSIPQMLGAYSSSKTSDSLSRKSESAAATTMCFVQSCP
jgi:hypothetical protein